MSWPRPCQPLEMHLPLLHAYFFILPFAETGAVTMAVGDSSPNLPYLSLLVNGHSPWRQAAFEQQPPERAPSSSLIAPGRTGPMNMQGVPLLRRVSQRVDFPPEAYTGVHLTYSHREGKSPAPVWSDSTELQNIQMVVPIAPRIVSMVLRSVAKCQRLSSLNYQPTVIGP